MTPEQLESNIDWLLHHCNEVADFPYAMYTETPMAWHESPVEGRVVKSDKSAMGARVTEKMAIFLCPDAAQRDTYMQRWSHWGFRIGWPSSIRSNQQKKSKVDHMAIIRDMIGR